MDIILFGTGSKAERFYYSTFNTVNILFCVDNNQEKINGSFQDINICDVNRIKDYYKKAYVVVASSYYSQIKDQLNSLGLIEFEDFIDSNLYRKKIAITWGNCHI